MFFTFRTVTMAKKQHAKKPTSFHNTESFDQKETKVTWIATSLLEDNLASGMKPKMLEEAKILMGNNTVAVIPYPDQRVDWYRPGWISFYYYPSEVGFTLPFLKLAKDVLNHLRIALGQLMHFAWRAIACVEAIEAKHKLKINVHTVRARYVLKKYSGCCYTFTNMDKDNPLVLNLDRVNDRGWKHNYLFTEKSALHASCEDLVEYWSAVGMFLNSSIFIVRIVFDSMPIL